MNPKDIASRAAEVLENAKYDPKKLALLHTGAALLFSLIMTVFNFIISKNMDATVGLAQMGTRAILGTIQTVLSLVGNLALPFWEVGFLYAALRNVRTRDAGPKDLTEGFRRLGAVARLYLLFTALALLLLFLCMELSSILISFTPYWRRIMEDAQALMESASATGQATLETGDMLTLLPAMTPMFLLFGVLLLALGIPVFYHFRLAFFALMDDATGARDALRCSARATKGHKLKLFKLDLHFWWYYAAQLFLVAVAYGDMILPAMGVQLPFSADVLFFLTYGIHIVLQLLLAWQFSSRVQTCYAVFYDKRKKDTATPEAPQLPEN